MADESALIEGEGATASEVEPQDDAAEQRFEQQQQRRRGHNDPTKRVLQQISLRKAAEFKTDQAEARVRELERMLAASSAHSDATKAGMSITEAQARLKAARFDGDADAEATALAALTEAQVTATLASHRAAEIEAVSKREREAPPRQPELSAEMEDWLERNDWFRTSRPMHVAAKGFHEEAMERGLRPESSEYFAHIDKRMRAAFPDKFEAAEEEETAPAEPATPRATPAAPAAPRRSAPANPAPTRSVRLTAEQREAARISGVTEQAYAAALLRRQQQAKG